MVYHSDLLGLTDFNKRHVNGYVSSSENPVPFDAVLLTSSLALQVLKRKPDLYRSEGLDIRVVFYCGE